MNSTAPFPRSRKTVVVAAPLKSSVQSPSAVRRVRYLRSVAFALGCLERRPR